MKKIKIALICGANTINIDDFHHYGFWKKTIEEDPRLEVAWFSWSDWKTMPEQFDLYLFLDFNSNLFELDLYKDKYHPRCFYWWDSFHNWFSLVSQIPRYFDKAYFAELPEALHCKMVGINNVEWLPGAFYPKQYFPINLEKKYDFTYVGQQDNLIYRKGLTRKSTLALLSSKYNGQILQNVRGSCINLAYNSSKILPERTIHYNIGTRLFELLGSGGFVLINRAECNNGLDLLGRDGEHFITYDDSEKDLMSKMEYYLKNEKEREEIAIFGYNHFIRNHTYTCRLNKILKDFGLGE